MAFYRSSRRNILGGICGGISERFGIRLFAVRLLMLILFFSTGIFPCLIVYALLCLVLPRRDSEFNYMAEQQQRVSPPVRYAKESKVPQSKIKYTVNQIAEISSRILSKRASNKIVARMMEQFKDKIVEFKDYSPKLEKQYNECLNFIATTNIEEIKRSIEDNRIRMENSSGNAKNNYSNIIEQKEMRLKLVSEIKDFKDVIESKLQLILDTIQNIEASILHAELRSQIEDEKYSDIQQHISVLSENITEVSDIFKKTKLRL